MSLEFLYYSLTQEKKHDIIKNIRAKPLLEGVKNESYIVAKCESFGRERGYR